MKGDHTVIGPGEPIPIPPRSARTTAEAELGLVIGRHCRNVSEADALDHLVSFGPEIVPLAEVLDGLGTLTNPVVQS